MVNAINRALEAQMQAKGLQLSAGEIYNADALSLTDAILSLDFGCTGSIISDNGLVITNHHCAYADVHAISTDEHNYLEDGFWAMNNTQEVPIKGKSIYFLKRVLDVTDEVLKAYADAKESGLTIGSRKMSSIMEQKYSKQTGLEASLYSMWSGSKYYIALYEVFTDIRLVAAPPVSISAYGGDIDNWEWPQHKCDFALYRIYAGKDGKPADFSADNVPYRPATKLKISLDGYKPGDFAMVIGYPGRTDRYASSAKIDYEENLSYPLSNVIRGDQMAIASKWMNADPQIRLKYADWYFSLSNIQENNEGMVQCFKRFGVLNERKALEKELQAWIDADPERKAKWGDLIAKLQEKYDLIRDLEKNLIVYRESLIRGTKLTVIATRLNSLERNLGNRNSVENMRRSNAASYAEFDFRVEHDLLDYGIKKFYAGVDSLYWGAFQKELYKQYGGDLDALVDMLWRDSWMSSESGAIKLLTSDGEELKALYSDKLYRFLTDVKTNTFTLAIADLQGDETTTTLAKEYTHALYQMREDKGIVQYPDANSSMRLSYGTVGGYEPKDGVWCSWYTSPAGILEKYDPESYDFNLKPDWKALLDSHCKGAAIARPEDAFNANFLSDNDITGGNSGSPVLNAKGELIGLAFDGNKESLASDVSFTEDYNKCVNVDIRYVIWTLRNYAHMDNILEEIGL